MNDSLRAQIAECGGRIDDIFFCPHRPEDNCECRKPKIGMGLQAISKYDLDPSKCGMCGDKEKDIDFGKALGMRSILVSESFTFVDAVSQILDSDS